MKIPTLPSNITPAVYVYAIVVYLFGYHAVRDVDIFMKLFLEKTMYP